MDMTFDEPVLTGKPAQNKQTSVVFIFSRGERPETEVSIPNSHYSIGDFVSFEGDALETIYKVGGIRHHLVLNGNLSTRKTFVVLSKLEE
jgi:hypothetical protein